MNKVEMAFREAGQVIIAMLWGVWRVEKVSIAGTGDLNSGIEYAHLTETEEKELRQRLGIRYFDAKLERIMGGPIAQAILLEREVEYQGATGDSDFDRIVAALQEDTPGSSPAGTWTVIHAHEPVVQADLKRMWHVVDALAQALISKQELADYEIRSIVRTAVNQLPENERNWAISRLRNTPPRV